MYLDIPPLDLKLAQQTPLARTLILSQAVHGPTKPRFALDLVSWLVAFALAGVGWGVVITTLAVGRWLFA